MAGATHSKRTALLVLVGLLVGLVVLGSLLPQKSRSEQIREGCQREFGSEGTERVNECAIAIMSSELEEDEQKKMERAAESR